MQAEWTKLKVKHRKEAWEGNVIMFITQKSREKYKFLKAEQDIPYIKLTGSTM